MVNKMNVFGETKRLFHGSKSGIKGKIQPISREQCDFGKGFYLGDLETQPKSLIASKRYPDSRFYEVDLDLTGLKVIHLDTDIVWALYIAKNRGIIPAPQKYEEYFNELDSADVVIGLIADDTMTTVLNEFYNNTLTDVALLEALSYVELGEQYVLKTQKACDKVTIVSDKKLTPKELKSFEIDSTKRRLGISEVVSKIRMRNLRKGKFFVEIVGDLDG